MARFDVYPNPEASERRRVPYLVDVQNEFIEGLDTRVVIPLSRLESHGPRLRDLNPIITVLGHECVLNTPALGAIPRAGLRKCVTNCRDSQAVIQGALDALFGAS